jgi:hypothetical protein
MSYFPSGSIMFRQVIDSCGNSTEFKGPSLSIQELRFGQVIGSLGNSTDVKGPNRIRERVSSDLER